MDRLAVWSIVAIAVVTVVAVTSLPGQGKGITWYGSLDEALEAAKESKKLVMLNLHTEWCGWCRELEDKTFPDEGVIEKSKEFECAQVDPEKTEVKDEYDDGSYPRTVFLNAEGEVVHVLPGYAAPEAFMAETERAKENAKKLEEAKVLEAKFAENPEDYAAASGAGTLLLEIGQAKRAVPLLKAAAENVDKLEEGARADAVADCGVALLQDSQWETALKVFKKAVETYGEHERIWEMRFALGLCYANLDKLVEARTQWQKVADGAEEGNLGRQAKDYVERVDQMLGEGEKAEG